MSSIVNTGMTAYALTVANLKAVPEATTNTNAASGMDKNQNSNENVEKSVGMTVSVVVHAGVSVNVSTGKRMGIIGRVCARV